MIAPWLAALSPLRDRPARFSPNSLHRPLLQTLKSCRQRRAHRQRRVQVGRHSSRPSPRLTSSLQRTPSSWPDFRKRRASRSSRIDQHPARSPLAPAHPSTSDPTERDGRIPSSSPTRRTTRESRARASPGREAMVGMPAVRRCLTSARRRRARTIQTAWRSWDRTSGRTEVRPRPQSSVVHFKTRPMLTLFTLVPPQLRPPSLVSPPQSPSDKARQAFMKTLELGGNPMDLMREPGTPCGLRVRLCDSCRRPLRTC